MSFPIHPAAQTSPSPNFLAVTTNAAFADLSRALYVGTGGVLVVRDSYGNDVTFVNVPDGSILPIQVMQVRSASTADDIVALF